MCLLPRPAKVESTSGKVFQCPARFGRGPAGSVAVERTSGKNTLSLLFSVY